MEKYNPHQAPDPEEWLAMDETERLDLVVAFHRNTGFEMESLTAHSNIHVVVENQLAEKIPEVLAAYRKLRQKKVDRHSAIHAIGAVVSELIFNAGKGIDMGSDPNAYYHRLLKKIKPSDWK